MFPNAGSGIHRKIRVFPNAGSGFPRKIRVFPNAGSGLGSGRPWPGSGGRPPGRTCIQKAFKSDDLEHFRAPDGLGPARPRPRVLFVCAGQPCSSQVGGLIPRKIRVFPNAGSGIPRKIRVFPNAGSEIYRKIRVFPNAGPGPTGAGGLRSS